MGAWWVLTAKDATLAVGHARQACKCCKASYGACTGSATMLRIGCAAIAKRPGWTARRQHVDVCCGVSHAACNTLRTWRGSALFIGRIRTQASRLRCGVRFRLRCREQHRHAFAKLQGRPAIRHHRATSGRRLAAARTAIAVAWGAGRAA